MPTDPAAAMSSQPRADARCAVCGHPGANHIRLLDTPPRCRCGCTHWKDSTVADQEVYALAHHLKDLLGGTYPVHSSPEGQQQCLICRAARGDEQP